LKFDKIYIAKVFITGFIIGVIVTTIIDTIDLRNKIKDLENNDYNTVKEIPVLYSKENNHEI
jgi:hypothetical protein